MRRDWQVADGLLSFVGDGYDNICTEKQYGDFEMYVDWRLDPNGKEPDAGIYLRGTPQVQIWDTSRRNVGAQVGFRRPDTQQGQREQTFACGRQ